MAIESLSPSSVLGQVLESCPVGDRDQASFHVNDAVALPIAKTFVDGFARRPTLTRSFR